MIKIVRLSSEQWKQFGEMATLIAFNEKDDKEIIDFALVAEGKDGCPLGYVTCREHDPDTIYLQYGGAFPSSKNTPWSFLAYQKIIYWCKERYSRITFIVENTNSAMLKFALGTDFKIIGLRFFNGKVLLEHALEV